MQFNPDAPEIAEVNKLIKELAIIRLRINDISMRLDELKGANKPDPLATEKMINDTINMIGK